MRAVRGEGETGWDKVICTMLSFFMGIQQTRPLARCKPGLFWLPLLWV